MISKKDKAIVFDFDCTLTQTHFFHFMYSNYNYAELREIMKPVLSYPINNDFKKICNNLSKMEKENRKVLDLFIKIIFGNEERLSKLNKFFYYLKDLGYNLFISSNGYEYEILSLLKLLGWHSYFKYISGREGIITNKGELISRYISKPRFIINYLFLGGYDKVIYVDDDDYDNNNGFIFNKKIQKYKKYNDREYLDEKMEKYIDNIHFINIGQPKMRVNYYFIKTLKYNGKGINEYSLKKINEVT